MLFDELNATSGRTIRENVNLNSMVFKPLKDFVGQTIRVDGFFFTEGRYGTQVVVVGNNAKINLPKREVARFKKIEQDEKLLNAMLNGHLALTNIENWETNIGSTVRFKYTEV